MTKLRITNNSKGPRGAWVAGRLEELAAGRTRTFSDATDADIAGAVANKEFRVQSSDDGSEWEELSTFEAPPVRPFIVLAKDADGNGARIVELQDGEWFIGAAIASERPEKPSGYTYEKIGGSSAPLTEEAAIVAHEFDATAYLNGNAADLIPTFKEKSPEVQQALLDAESAKDKPRKGVVAALEELLTADETEKDTIQD